MACPTGEKERKGTRGLQVSVFDQQPANNARMWAWAKQKKVGAPLQGLLHLMSSFPKRRGGGKSK